MAATITVASCVLHPLSGERTVATACTAVGCVRVMGAVVMQPAPSVTVNVLVPAGLVYGPVPARVPVPPLAVTTTVVVPPLQGMALVAWAWAISTLERSTVRKAVAVAPEAQPALLVSTRVTTSPWESAAEVNVLPVPTGEPFTDQAYCGALPALVVVQEKVMGVPMQRTTAGLALMLTVGMHGAGGVNV